MTYCLLVVLTSVTLFFPERSQEYFMSNYDTIFLLLLFFEITKKLQVAKSYRCSTCGLVLGCWRLNHVIFLKLKKKERLAKLSKFTK